MTIRNDFAVFILTHGRPDNVKTFSLLNKAKYSGKTFLVVDDKDKTLPQYIERFGKDSVLVFSKDKIAESIDFGDNFHDKKGVIIYARNACFRLAKKLGLKYFIQLDDDYTRFEHRFDAGSNYFERTLLNIDPVFEALVSFLENTPSLSIAMLQSGDFIGGKNNPRFSSNPTLVRKVMNSFVCSTDKPFVFKGRINEDVNTYTSLASTGNLFFSCNHVSLKQLPTQKNKGGMTETYLDSGTYLKSFYSVIFHPSSVVVQYRPDMGRMHHTISWKCTTPMILREENRK